MANYDALPTDEVQLQFPFAAKQPLVPFLLDPLPEAPLASLL
jgi:hypothetical protein